MRKMVVMVVGMVVVAPYIHGNKVYSVLPDTVQGSYVLYSILTVTL